MTRIRCLKCNDIVTGDGKGTMIWCRCYAVGIDDHFGCVRIVGNKDDWEEVEMTEIKELKHFEIRCKKCGAVAAIEICESESYRNDTSYEYPEAICKHCHIREGLL